MFRRSRGNSGPKWFSRQISGTLTTTAAALGGATDFVGDGSLLVPEATLAAGGTHGAKQIDIAGISFTTDYVQKAGDFVPGNSQTLFGAEGLYVDQLQEDGTPVHNGLVFLSIASIQSATELDDMPLRVIHRRRFTTNYLNLGAGGASNFAANVAYINPGWGTERSIRRRVRLRMNEGLFWRYEIYGVPGGATINSVFQGDLLGVISYRVQT